MPPLKVEMEQAMKHFMIKYSLANGTTADWHREIKALEEPAAVHRRCVNYKNY